MNDIKPDWLNLVRRMQSIARRQSGYAIISVTVVVNQDGIPMFYNEPEVTKLAPRAAATRFLTELIGGIKRG